MSTKILQPRLGNRAKLATIIKDEATFATSLLAIVVDQYGTEVLSGGDALHPTTLRLELEGEFGVELPVINGDKLSAAIDILMADSFFQRVPTFVQYCNVLSDNHPDFGSFDPADVTEVAWGITEAMLIADPEEDDPFSEEVRGYVGKVVHDEGIKTPPDVLRIGNWNPDYSAMPTDDPTMFAAHFQSQADESQEITTWLQKRLMQLITQLSALPLEHGDMQKLQERVAQGLRSS